MAGGATLEEIDRWDSLIYDLSDWEIPQVRYVEAYEVDSRWT